MTHPDEPVFIILLSDSHRGPSPDHLLPSVDDLPGFHFIQLVPDQAVIQQHPFSRLDLSEA